MTSYNSKDDDWRCCPLTNRYHCLIFSESQSGAWMNLHRKLTNHHHNNKKTITITVVVSTVQVESKLSVPQGGPHAEAIGGLKSIDCVINELVTHTYIHTHTCPRICICI